LHAAFQILALCVAGLAGQARSLGELERELRAPRPETRRAAVRELAGSNERRAWDLVVRALGDPESMVADEAEVALGSTTDARLVNDLFGSAGIRARDPWVRLRVAEALGRVQLEIGSEAMARALAGSEPGEVELRRMLLWTIERLAKAGRLGGDRTKAYRAAERIAVARTDAELRGAALQTLSILDPLAAHDLVLEALAHGDGALRCAALLAVSRLTEQECLSRSERALDDPETRVRAQAIENLEGLASRAANLALIRRMEIEKCSRLRFSILAGLRARSGLDLGFDVAAWRGWAEAIEGRLSTGGRPGGRSFPAGATKASFAGMNLTSDRVCFLIDFSGSTWQTKVGERTRKEVLDLKLRSALESLPEGTRFNVIPYTNEPIPWEKRLVASGKADVRRALEFFERCHQSGRGNFFDAALLALEDPDVDTIVTLTDGVPTGGRRWNLELMIELLVERNRFRKVAFDSVLVDAPRSKQRSWADLAQRTGGRSIVADLE